MSAKDEQQKPVRRLTRRSFLRLTSATAGLSALSGCIGGGDGGSAAAADDASLAAASPTGSTSSTAGGAGGASGTSNLPPLTPQPRTGQAAMQIVLSSPTAQSLAPFSSGQSFRQGDIPSGSGVVADIPNFQATIKNRWPDGSAKFAVVSGRANLTANTPLTVTLSAGSAAAGTALTEQDLLATGISATTTFSGAGSVDLRPLIGTASSYNAGARRWTPGRVAQWVSGSEMSSWIYYAPLGTDAHLAAWFEVRLWRGGHVEVLPWVENGYLLVASPTTKSGTVSFSLNGTQRFSGNLSFGHHTRTVLVSGRATAYWAGNDPQVTARPNAAYLSASKLVPEYYGNTAAQSRLFARLVTDYTPFARHNFPTAMGTAGYDESIGLLPEWDASYFTTGADVRALAAVIVNGYAAGRYSIHYRDETTNRPIRFTSYPTLVIYDDNNTAGIGHVGVSSNGMTTPPTQAAPPALWQASHEPSVGYMAYMLTGRWYFMETVQFAATANYLHRTDTGRFGAKGIWQTNLAGSQRLAAWCLRTLIQAASATPDDDAPLRTELVTSFEEHINFYHAKYVAKPNHPQGVCAPYSDYTASDGKYEHAIWMEDFFTAAWGYGLDLKITSAGSTTKHQDFFNWKAQAIVGRLGGTAATEYNFRDAARYTLMVAPSDNADWETGVGPWYANWGAIYQATTGNANAASAETALRGGNFPDATSYWGNLQPAIAYAVDHNVPGARTGYQRMATASNWSQIVAGWGDDPVWGVRPRSV